MQIQSKSQYRKSLAFAFAIPVISILLIQLAGGYEPFGDRSMLYSDMYHQYYPFWVAFRRALRSGDSMLYTWAVGLGQDYLSLISYYLASPLNLLALLVPESWTLEIFSLLVPVKLGLASLFFAIFLHKTFNTCDLSLSIFAAFYGLCAWALGYQWNVMWLDTFALLPLLALGTVQLLRDKKFILYTLTLFLSVYANYYVGLFVCIFVLLLFFIYEICRWKGWKRLCGDFFRIGFFTVIAIGMTTFITLPALAGLMNTQSSVNNFPVGFQLNITSEDTIVGLLDAMRQVAGNTLGAVEPTFKEGLPNLYCGVGSLMLAYLFCTNKKIRLRDKVCALLLLVFFMLSFIIRQLDYIWHGFHFTNMIPYRFSFLFSFVLLYMAYRAWLLRDRFTRPQIIRSGILILLLVFISDSGTDPVCMIYNLGFLILYLVVFLLGKKEVPSAEADENTSAVTRENSKWVSAGLLAVMGLEIALNVLNFGVRFPYTTVSNYPKGTEDTKAVIAYMESLEADTPFYRAETTHTQTLNDGALNGYNGITTFTSSANVRTTLFMKALGYGAKNTYNRYAYEESSPVANLFLGIKYMIERDGAVEENTYFNTIYTSGDVYLLENNAYLPLGFLANEELADVDWDYADPFTQQNVIFRAATGMDENVWNMVNTDPQIIAEDVSIDSISGNTCYYSAGRAGSTITYDITSDRNGFGCLHLDVTDRNSYKVYLNDELLYSESMSLPQMIAVSDVQAGDRITVKLTVKDGEEGRITIKAGILDGSTFRSGYQILESSTLQLTTFSNTLVNGSISCDRDGLMYTSIPYDGNWVLYVDETETEPELVGDCMMAVPLTAGLHAVRFEYHNQAFSLGWKISLVCLAVFAICVIVTKQHCRKPGKYQRKK